MLDEAIDVMRKLWDGEEVTHRGEHYVVDRARLWDKPVKPLRLALAAGGPKAAELAARKQAGLFATESKQELVQAWSDAGGRGPRYAEVPLCWAANETEAKRLAHERFRFGVGGWKVNAELPTSASFEAATSTVRPDDVAESVACGPDPERHIEAIRKYLKAGFDHLVLLAVGPDQAGFFKFWQAELTPRLRQL